jgi:YbbR domain-containing protein
MKLLIQKFYIKFTIFLLLSLCFFTTLNAEQKNQELEFDLGFTRTKELNLWPILSYYFAKDSTEAKVNVAFSLYNYHRDDKKNFYKNRLIPLYWKK